MVVRPEEGGLAVLSVDPDSPAGESGVERDDVIESLAGEGGFDQSGFPGLVEVVRKLRPGEPVEIVVRRGEESRALEIVPHANLELAAVELERVFRHQENLPAEVEAALPRVVSTMRSAVAGARRTNQLYEELNNAIGSLGVSHAALIPPWSYAALLEAEEGSDAAKHLGFFLEPIEVGGAFGWFVRSIMAGSPAESAGLLVGDEIVKVEEVPTAASPRLVLAGFESFHERRAIRVDPDETVALTIRRNRDAEPENIEITADRPLSAMSAIRASVRVIDTPGGPVGYIHLWNLLSRRLPRFFRRTLSDELATARGLVVDLRGRGGSIDVLLAIEEILIRDGRPIVLLTDRETRSAKEVLAYRLRPQPDIVLVGERTAGAVLPGTLRPLPDGGQLLYPLLENRAAVNRLTGGVALERRGVEPELEVPYPIPYAAGRDPVLAAGIEALGPLLDRSGRRVRL